MAAQAAACRPACRSTPPFHSNGQGRATLRRVPRASHVVRSSLEEEFKKQCLGMSNGTSSSSQPERLKDLSASASSQRGADLASSSNSSSSSSSSSAPGGGAAGGAAAQAPQPPPAPSSGDPLLNGGLPGPLSSLGGAEAYHPLEFYPTSHIHLDWGAEGGALARGAAGPPPDDRGRCFVILFGVGRAETEGIYSLRAVAKDDGLPVDTIVAFEAEDDAARYSTLLEATMDHVPTVWPIEWGELLEFCNSAGYRCRLEPAGSLLIPPDYNVGMTDWEKSLRLRKGEFSVLGAEPSAAAPQQQQQQPGQGIFADSPAWVFDSAAPLVQDDADLNAELFSHLVDMQLSSPAALDAMRASLERLLPRDE